MTMAILRLRGFVVAWFLVALAAEETCVVSKPSSHAGSILISMTARLRRTDGCAKGKEWGYGLKGSNSSVW